MGLSEFQNRLGKHAESIERALEERLSTALRPGEVARPQRLLDAMRHGSMEGGKRIRPFLVMETAALFGVSAQTALPAAVALEFIHCYSLIHDDLPDMDNDDLRRGKPTVHKAYDPATAILAGDALLTMAFEILAEEACHSDPAVRSELVLALTRAAGLGGMVGGQMLDLAAENESWDESAITTMQAMKTGALIRYGCEAGAILGQASTDDRERLVAFGKVIGRAFQLADDILDVTASTEALGKTAAKDIDAEKETLVSLYGLEKARVMASDLLGEANDLLDPFGERAAILKAAAAFIVERDR